MSEKYKHSERLEETLRYLNDAMTNEERYSFEREVERDPFMQEAFEGLSSIKSSEIDRDIRSIDIFTGKKRKSFFIVKVLAYAAGFALLVSLGFWAVQNIDFSKKKTAETADDSESIQLREPYKPATTDTTTVVDSSKALVADAGLSQTPTANNLSVQSTLTNGLVAEKGITLKGDQATAKDLNKKKLATKTSNEKSASLIAQEQDVASEITKNAESESAVQAAPVSDVQQKSTEDIEEVENALKRPGVNADPEPLGGSTLFRDYLDKNARYPGGIQNAKKEFVKLKFKISKTGQPFGIVVEKSPDQEFSQEAIRLILEGPKWSPEIKDGIPVEGEVSVKINFKP
jgi:hypothetical protein